MDTKDKLDIVIITFNRCACLKTTLDDILAPNSPIKDYDITVLDNASYDRTRELVEEYQTTHKNLKYIVNPKNVGGCVNAIKAFTEIPKKEYVWVIGDNDRYDFSNWAKIEEGINQTTI